MAAVAQLKLLPIAETEVVEKFQVLSPRPASRTAPCCCHRIGSTDTQTLPPTSRRSLGTKSLRRPPDHWGSRRAVAIARCGRRAQQQPPGWIRAKPHPRLNDLIGGRSPIKGVGHIEATGQVIVPDAHVREVHRRGRQMSPCSRLRSPEGSVAEPGNTAACDPGTQHSSAASARRGTLVNWKRRAGAIRRSSSAGGVRSTKRLRIKRRRGVPQRCGPTGRSAHHSPEWGHPPPIGDPQPPGAPEPPAPRG